MRNHEHDERISWRRLIWALLAVCVGCGTGGVAVSEVTAQTNTPVSTTTQPSPTTTEPATTATDGWKTYPVPPDEVIDAWIIGLIQEVMDQEDFDAALDGMDVIQRREGWIEGVLRVCFDLQQERPVEELVRDLRTYTRRFLGPNVSDATLHVVLMEFIKGQRRACPDLADSAAFVIEATEANIKLGDG